MRPGRILLGLVLVGVGLAYLLQALGAPVDAGRFISRWWPTVLIAAGLLQLAHRPGAPFWPLVVMVVGALLLVDRLGDGPSFGLLWPVLLILLGARALVAGASRAGPADAGSIDLFASFWERQLESRARPLSGGKVTALMGAAVLDLRQAEPAPEGATLALSSVLGSVTVIVPEGWDVRLRAFPILGAVVDGVPQARAGATDAPRLDVQATAVFGRIEIRTEP